MAIIRFISPVFPMLSVALLTFVSLLPWGSSASLHFLLPLLPLVGVHYWVVRKPQFMPVLFVFLCGLAVDALTSGPLGIWSLAYVVGFLLTSWFGKLPIRSNGFTRYIIFALCMILVAATIWAVSSIYFARVFDWRPLFNAVLAVTLVYPVVALVLWPLNISPKVAELGSLTRGT